MAAQTLSKRALTYMLAQLSANVVGFFSWIVLARAFSKEQMGDYQQLMMIYTLFSAMLIAGLPSCLTYFYPTSDEEHKPTTVYIVLIGLFLAGMLLGAVTFFASPLIAGYFHNDRLLGLMRSFFLFYAFTLGSAYMRRFLVATGRYRFMMFWLPFDRLLMLLSFAAPALLGMGLERAVVIAVWVAGAKFVITTVYTMSVVPPAKMIWDGGLVGRMLVYSIPIGLSQAVGQISRQVDRLVIGRYMSTEFFATFTWAALALPFIPEIAESVTTVLIPELARLHKDGDNAKFIAIWQESIRKTAIVIMGVFGLVEALAEPIIVAIYSDKYIDSVGYFRLYQIGLLMRVTLFGAILQAVGKTRQILYGSAAVLAIKSVLNVLLYKAIGPTGPIFGSLFLGVLVTAYFVRFISRELGTTVKRVWPWSYHLRAIASAVVAGAAAFPANFIPHEVISSVVGLVSAWAAPQTSIIAAVRLVVGGAVFGPIYILMLHFLGVLKAKDWRLLRDMTYGRFIGA